MMVCLRSLKDFGSVDCKVTCIEEKLFMIEEEIQSQNNQCQCGQSSVSERYLNFSYLVSFLDKIVLLLLVGSFS